MLHPHIASVLNHQLQSRLRIEIDEVAQPDGSGGFSPSGILAGTFSFDAIGLQTVPTAGSIGPVVHVDGCFRVNLPTPEMGVPVTPSPAAPACS